MINPFKKKKKEKTLKNYIEIKGFYPEFGIVKEQNGFSKLYRIMDVEESKKEYYEEALLTRFLIFLERVREKESKEKSFIKIYIEHGKVYVIFHIYTKYIENAFLFFSSIEAEGILEVPIEENLSLLESYFHFKEFKGNSYVLGKKIYKREFSPFPYHAKNMEEGLKDSFKTLNFGGKFVKCGVISYIPGNLSHAFLSEVAKLPIRIVIYINKVNEKICLETLEKKSASFSKEREKNIRTSLQGGNLYNVEVFFSAVGDTKDDVRKLWTSLKKKSSSFQVEINDLNAEQDQAFRSQSPLGRNRVPFYKVLARENLLSILPYSYQSHFGRGVFMGRDNSDNVIYFDRMSTALSGFILSSEKDNIIKTIKEETAYFISRGKKVEIYSLDDSVGELFAYTNVDDFKNYFSGILELDREILRAIGRKLFSFQGQIKREHNEIVNFVVDGMETISFPLFKEKMKDASMLLYKRMEYTSLRKMNIDVKKIENNVVFLSPKDKALKAVERIALVLSRMAVSDADAIYFLDGEELVGTKFYEIFQRKMQEENRLFTVCSVHSREVNGNKRMLDSHSLSGEIKRAPFLQIGYLDTADRVALNRVLSLSKSEKMNINNIAEDTGLYRFIDYMTVYHYRKESNEQSVKEGITFKSTF